MVTREGKRPGVRRGVAREILTGSNMGFLRVRRNWRGRVGGRAVRSSCCCCCCCCCCGGDVDDDEDRWELLLLLLLG